MAVLLQLAASRQHPLVSGAAIRAVTRGLMTVVGAGDVAVRLASAGLARESLALMTAMVGITPSWRVSEELAWRWRSVGARLHDIGGPFFTLWSIRCHSLDAR